MIGWKVQKIIRNNNICPSSFQEKVLDDLSWSRFTKLDFNSIMLGKVNHLLLKLNIHVLQVKVDDHLRLHSELIFREFLLTSINSPIEPLNQ